MRSWLPIWLRMSCVLAPVVLAAVAYVPPRGPKAGQDGTPSQAFLPVVAGPSPAPCPAAQSQAAPPDGRPSWGTPITVAPQTGEVWVANPDAGSVSLVNPWTQTLVAEIHLGGEPWSVAAAPDGPRLYVVDRAGGALVVIDTARRTPCARIPVGPEPGQAALGPDGREVYVTVTHAAEVAVVDTAALAVSRRIAVQPRPFAVAVTDDGDEAAGDERIYVTHLQALPRPGAGEGTDDGREARVTVNDAGAYTVTSEIALSPDAHGFPNLLGGITLAPDGQRAWLPHVRAAPALPNDLTTTVFAAVGGLDLDAGREDFSARLLLNDLDVFGSPVNNPVAAVPAPDGQMLYIVLAGSNLVEVVDVSVPAHPRLIKFLPVGQNPRGLALSDDGRHAYVMNYLSRSVTVLDLEALALLAEIPVTAETLPPDVLRGKVLFNSAVDPRLSQGAWLSCASCHPDGGTDGVTWGFPDGPRQTPPLWNAARTLPWHWSAALDEYQDVEDTIQRIQHGLGLAPGADPPLLGAPNAGRSADLDALAAFLAYGTRPPAVPTPAADMTAGRALFQSAGCAACHGGLQWTSSAQPGTAGALDPDGNGMVDEALRQVGTRSPADVRGVAGFDPPSLLGVGLTAPYFHDGSMPDLETLLRSGHPDPLGSGNGLSASDVGTLVRFLSAIGPDTVPVDALGGDS